MPKTAARRTRSKSGFRAADILELRRTLGALMGKKTASRQLLARLVESSPGSVFNWERGTVPSKHYIAKLQDLKRRVEASELNLGLNLGKSRATKGSESAHTPSGSGASPGRSSIGSSWTASAPNVRPIYVNAVDVASEDGTSWLRFGLKPPGTRTAEAIVELVIPTRLLETLRTDRRGSSS